LSAFAGTSTQTDAQSRRYLRARGIFGFDGYMGVSRNIVMKGTTGKFDDFRTN
jgi:hypothetical protein